MSLLLFSGNGCGSLAPSPAVPVTAEQAFREAPSKRSYAELLLEASRRPDDPRMAGVQLFEQYHKERVQRDLPNSMARGDHLDEHLDQQDATMRHVVAAIREKRDDTSLNFVEVLATHGFDRDRQFTAAEVLYRCARDRFAQVESTLNDDDRDHPIIIVRDRFTAGDGRIGGF